MTKKFRYEFDIATRILFKYYYGPITIEDIESSWLYAFDHDLIPNDTAGFILDYREANFKIERHESIKIAEFYKKHLAVFGGFKIAIITENPKDIIIPVLVETKDDGYFSKPFTTVEAAEKWVLS